MATAVATRVVNWSDIVAECGNYKAGFVATYQRYEGMSTDEGDKVTMRSFADHMGIARETFRRWVTAVTDPSWVTAEARGARTAASHANVVKNMAKKDPVGLVTAIEEAGFQVTDEVFHELKLRRAGIPPSTRANRKAAEAQASQVADPWKQAATRNSCEIMPAEIEELIESLETAVAAGNVAMQTLDAIIDAANRLVTTATAAKAFA